MQVVWQNQNNLDETLQDATGDYFDAFSGKELSSEEESSDWTDDESLVELQAHPIVEEDSKITPILIRNHVKEKNRELEQLKQDVHVQIQASTEDTGKCRKKIPRTPIPGHDDPLAKRLHARLQSDFEKLEFDKQKRQVQNYPLKLTNSSLFKKRETRTIAI